MATPREARRSARRSRQRRRRLAAAAAVLLLGAAVPFLAAALVPRDASDAEASSTLGREETTEPTKTPAAGTDDLPAPEAQREAVARLVELGYPVYCGGGKKDLVALTFDDGPGPYTPLAVRHLQRSKVRATFFISGSTLATYGSYVRSEARLGALGNHSWNHVDLTFRSPAEVRDQLSRTKREVERLSGTEMLVFRPPYGSYDEMVVRESLALGMVPVIWNVVSGDSDGYSWEQIGAAVEAGLRPGAIILMHENRGQTIRALHRLVLPALERSGLRAVTVPELLALDPPSEAQLRQGARGC